MYRIHGTDAPWLIGQQVSHGCIRMYTKMRLIILPSRQSLAPGCRDLEPHEHDVVAQLYWRFYRAG